MKDDSLPYEYLDEEDEGTEQKKKKSAQTRRDKTRVYQKPEADSEKRRKTPSKHGKTADYTPVKARKKAGSSKKAQRKKQKSSGVAGVIALIMAAVLIFSALFMLDYKQVVSIGGFSAKLIALFRQNDPVAQVNNAPHEMDNLFSDIESEQVNDGLTAADGGSVSVKDLAITPGLDETWLNVLLLGADSRNPNEPCRTDTMMICSVNQKTGEIKLTSIMRDTAVEINGRTVRINAAYYFGNANLAMRTVNEYFGMNIKYYAFVDFAGFAAIAEKLGGVDMNLTKAEMDNVNHNVREQYAIQIKQGKIASETAIAEYLASELKEYGSNIHLNGMQTLGYARIRKTDSDFSRADRQRAVLNQLMLKLKGASQMDVMTLVYGSTGSFKTNVDLNTIVNIATLVLGREGFDGAQELRLPVNKSYKQERRNNEDMLYDMDVETNTRKLYEFIYAK